MGRAVGAVPLWIDPDCEALAPSAEMLSIPVGVVGMLEIGVQEVVVDEIVFDGDWLELSLLEVGMPEMRIPEGEA